MTLANNKSQLTRLSDHTPNQSLIYGLGTTTDPIIEACKGDMVAVLSIDGALTCAMVGFCAAMSGPAAIITVPLSLVAWGGIMLNAAIVCSQYEDLSSDISGFKFEELPASEGFEPPVGQSCLNCRFVEGWGHCTKWGDTVEPNEWCQDWSNTIDVAVVHHHSAPAPVPTPPVPAPVVATRSQAVALDEELAIAKKIFAPNEPELSPDVAALHTKLQEILKTLPDGFPCPLKEAIDASGLPEATVLQYFSELEEKRPKHYSVTVSPVTLRVKGVR